MKKKYYLQFNGINIECSYTIFSKILKESFVSYANKEVQHWCKKLNEEEIKARKKIYNKYLVESAKKGIYADE